MIDLACITANHHTIITHPHTSINHPHTSAVEMGLGASGVGIFIATTALGSMVCNIPFGTLTDRIGRKPLMIGGNMV